MNAKREKLLNNVVQQLVLFSSLAVCCCSPLSSAEVATEGVLDVAVWTVEHQYDGVARSVAFPSLLTFRKVLKLQEVNTNVQLKPQCQSGTE